MSEAVIARISLIEARQPSRGFAPLCLHPVDPPERAAAVPEPGGESDPFSAGMAQGERVATEAFARERAALLRLVAAAQALQPEPLDELAALIATTVEQLVVEIVGMMPVGPDWLAARIDRAMGCLAEADAARTLWLHPDDAALLGDAPLALDVRHDATLEPGALRIDCAHGWIEDGRSIHLDNLRALLGSEAGS
jgi:flagellar assembly protein FliH